MGLAARVFDPETRAKILLNRNVLKVGDTQITYSPDFKVKAVRANLVEGKTPLSIFLEAGFDLDLIGREAPKHSLKEWRAVYRQRGEEGLREDQRGRHSTGRTAERELTVEEQLRRAVARIRYLEKENELLKKTRRDRKGRG
ncbi:MAG TPA: HTH domain-containing protein [Symbiobacteriaceae bacterium]|nr:HTH domain-containing protein [Symbiobacteriaceae bacterium]